MWTILQPKGADYVNEFLFFPFFCIPYYPFYFLDFLVCFCFLDSWQQSNFSSFFKSRISNKCTHFVSVYYKGSLLLFVYFVCSSVCSCYKYENPHEISLKQFSKKPYVCCSNCVITSLSLLTIYLSDKIGNIFHFSGEYHTDKKYTTSHSKSYLNASFSDNAFYDALNYHRITLHYIFHWDGKRERERKTNLLNHGR